jgi:hypothetical protein
MQYRFSILLDPFRTDDRNVDLCRWLELVAYTMLATGPGVFPVRLMTFRESQEPLDHQDPKID